MKRNLTIFKLLAIIHHFTDFSSNEENRIFGFKMENIYHSTFDVIMVNSEINSY
jgi:hypothetical protein